MKYIIDIEDEYTKDWVTETPMCKELCMPISVPNRQRTYHVVTGFKLEPYTEPDRKAIDLQHAHDIENVARMNYSKGAEDAWEFVNTLYGLSDEELYEIFDDGNYCEHSYQEAKAKYETWKKQKAEIRVGDEVYDHTISETGIVTNVKNKNMVGIMWNDGSVSNDVLVEDLQKTGRHFDEIEELLKKMKEEEE